MDKLRRNLFGQEDGLQGALKGATGLTDLQALITCNGGEIAIDLRQKGSGEVVVEAMVGACNNGDRSFFEEGAVLKTAKVVRAVVDAPFTRTSAGLLYQHNRNFGGCEKTVDKKGQTNCRPHRQYPSSLLAAEKQITAALHKAVSMDLPAARYLLVHEFGDFRADREGWGSDRVTGKGNASMSTTEQCQRRGEHRQGPLPADGGDRAMPALHRRRPGPRHDQACASLGDRLGRIGRLPTEAHEGQD